MVGPRTFASGHANDGKRSDFQSDEVRLDGKISRAELKGGREGGSWALTRPQEDRNPQAQEHKKKWRHSLVF